MNIGIFDAGGIAKVMATTINGMKDATLYGVGSRSYVSKMEGMCFARSLLLMK